MIQETSHIYVLSDPRTSEIRYVGKTTKILDRRLAGHFYTARRGGTCHRDRWIRQLLAENMAPRIVSVETGVWDMSTLNDKEIRWIDFLTQQGHPLTNMTVGGDGFRGGIVSDETKKKMSESHLDLQQNPEYVSMMRDCHQKYWANNDRARKAVASQTKARWADKNSTIAIANQQQRQCNDCGRVLFPRHMGRHLKHYNHSGFIVLEVS